MKRHAFLCSLGAESEPVPFRRITHSPVASITVKGVEYEVDQSAPVLINFKAVREPGTGLWIVQHGMGRYGPAGDGTHRRIVE